MAGNNLSPIQDATATATATIAIAAIATAAATTAAATTTIKPSIQALQYAKVLFISATPTQLTFSGRGHNPHTFSQSVFIFILDFILEAASFDMLCLSCRFDFVIVAFYIIST